jgi:hypothetical protein
MCLRRAWSRLRGSVVDATHAGAPYRDLCGGAGSAMRGPELAGYMRDRVSSQDRARGLQPRKHGADTVRVATDCKTVDTVYVGSNPTPATQFPQLFLRILAPGRWAGSVKVAVLGTVVPELAQPGA